MRADAASASWTWRLQPSSNWQGALVITVVAKAATTSIPIVFSIGADPIAAGLVSSLNRPGGNLVTLGVELGPKRLELAREIVPAAISAVSAR
jgi:ABC-type uncharacterized transport system substrate-binding protein